MATTKRNPITFKVHKPKAPKLKQLTKVLSPLYENRNKIMEKVNMALKIRNDEQAMKRILKEIKELL